MPAAMFLECLRTGNDLKSSNVFKIFKPGKLPTWPKTYKLNSLLAGLNTNPLLHVLDATNFLFDTGVEVSLVPPNKPDLNKPPSLSLISANGSPIKSYGTRLLDLRISKNKYTWRFQVAAIQ